MDDLSVDPTNAFKLAEGPGGLTQIGKELDLSK